MEEEAHSPQRPLPNDEHSRRNCIIANLKDSLLSQLAESNPSLSIKTCSASSLIQCHLQKLFISFNTPTHPPYALMIHKAITELNEENGSTEEAISDFIQREYEDLPWAHKRILGIQLGKLCQDGELVCNDGGRYVLVVDGDIGGDGKQREEHKGRKKRTRGKKGNDHHVDTGGEKGKVRKSCEVVERGNEVKEGGIKEQIQLHGLDSARTDEPIRLVEYAQEKGEEALNQSIERVEEQAESKKMLIEVVGIQSQSQEAGVVDQYVEVEASAQESQVQDSILYSETIFSSKPTALNGLDSQQPLLLPSSKSVPSEGIELSLTQLKLQMSSSLYVHGQKQDENPVLGDLEQHCRKRDRRGRPPKAKRVADNQEESLLPLCDVIVNAQKPNVNKIGKQWLSQPQGRGIGRGRRCKRLRMFKNKAILAYANVHNEQPQHGNQGSPKRNLYENPMSGDPEQSPQKHPRGRPPKLKPVENYPGPFLSSDDGILSEQKPKINKMEKQHLYCRGRGKGSGRGRGRPPKLNRNANHYEKQLQKEDQAQQHGRGRGRGRGRPRKLDRNTYTNLCEQHLQPQDQAEGLVSFHTLGGYHNQSLEQKQLQLRSQEEGSQQQQGQGWD